MPFGSVPVSGFAGSAAIYAICGTSTTAIATASRPTWGAERARSSVQWKYTISTESTTEATKPTHTAPRMAAANAATPM